MSSVGEVAFPSFSTIRSPLMISDSVTVWIKWCNSNSDVCICWTPYGQLHTRPTISLRDNYQPQRLRRETERMIRHFEIQISVTLYYWCYIFKKKMDIMVGKLSIKILTTER